MTNINLTKLHERREEAKMVADKVKAMKVWIKELHWDEDDSRNDADFRLVLSPLLADGDNSDKANELFASATKKDFVALAKECCYQFSDMVTLDSISITLDGDAEDTTVSIHADVHLGESD